MEVLEIPAETTTLDIVKFYLRLERDRFDSDALYCEPEVHWASNPLMLVVVYFDYCNGAPFRPICNVMRFGVDSRELKGLLAMEVLELLRERTIPSYRRGLAVFAALCADSVQRHGPSHPSVQEAQ